MSAVMIRRLIPVIALIAAALGPVSTASAQVAPQPLPPVTAEDRILGRADAPVTVVEYASFVCSHCATWNIASLPDFQARFIDTGKVRLIQRDMLTAPVQEAATAAAIARCAAPERYYEVAHTLFVWQATARNIGPYSEWYDRAVAVSGRTPEAVRACVEDPATTASIRASVASGAAAGVQGTPTFFVNGRKVENGAAPGALDAAVSALLP